MLPGLTATGLFAWSDIAIRFRGSGYNPVQMIFVAGPMSFPLTAALAMADPAVAKLRPRQPGLLAVRSVVVLLKGIFGTCALATPALAQSYAIFVMMPIFITLLAVPVLGA